MLPQDYPNKYLLISCLKLAAWLKSNYSLQPGFGEMGTCSLSLSLIFKQEYKMLGLIPIGKYQSYCDSTVF